MVAATVVVSIKFVLFDDVFVYGGTNGAARRGVHAFRAQRGFPYIFRLLILFVSYNSNIARDATAVRRLANAVAVYPLMVLRGKE